MTQVIGNEVQILPHLVERTSEMAHGFRFKAEPYIGERGDTFGVTRQENGYNFAIHVNGANAVDFCLYNPEDPNNAELRWQLNETEIAPDGRKIYTGFIRGLMPGDLYGIRVDRSKKPKDYDDLLVDPYAKAITRLGMPDQSDSPLFCVITDSASDIEMVDKPVINPKERVIYETHIRDATKHNPDIPEELRGTYAGFGHPANIEHLLQLGIKSVELQPVHQFVSEEPLVKRGMVNHWGYNTLGFFAPHEGYSSDKRPGAQIPEFKTMVNALHAAGIEVILDVVYNHTADGPHKYETDDGRIIPSPTYSLRGLDDEGYYHRSPNEDEPAYYDTTGCGNTVDTSKPAAAQLVERSLEYWAEEMGVDGFRFDLAPSVGSHGFFRSLKQNPKLTDCLMIAEPWSWGCGYPKSSYASIGIPEWNGEFRDEVRDFWRGQGSLGRLAYVMAGSFSSNNVINLITAHDGFRLRDLVSYDYKHNERNRQPTNNGEDNNRSYNHGVEGDTDDPSVNNLREITLHNMVNTLFMSRGVPMWNGGDELLHTQKGNNNAYCREATDTEEEDIHSYPWEQLSPNQKKMVHKVAGAIAIRKSSSTGDPTATTSKLSASPIGERGLDWFNSKGYRMSNEDWTGRVMGMYSSGRAGSTDSESYITYVNGSAEEVQVRLPEVLAAAGDYVFVSDAKSGEINPDGIRIVPETFTLGAMSSAVVKRISSRLPHSEIQNSNLPKINFPTVGRNIIDIQHSNGQRSLQDA